MNGNPDTFVNKGEFFDKHPDVFGCVTKFEKRDIDGNLEEYWERDDDGYMRDRTERKKLEEEIAKAEKELDKYIAEDTEEIFNGSTI